MKKVQIQDFMDYRYLGSLQVSPDQQHAVFTVITADREEDKYPGNLWLLDLQTKRTRQLTSGNEEKKAIWWNNDTLVFTGCRDPKLKEKTVEGESMTVFYKLNIHGGEATEWFRLAMPVGSFQKVNDNQLILSVAYRADGMNDFECKNDDEKKKWKEERDSHKDYEWFDEIPFWANGQGITNMKRSRLYLLDLDSQKTTPISEPSANASISHIQDNKLLYISNPMNSVREIPSSLHQFDCTTKQDLTLIPDHEVNVSWAFYIKHKIIAAISDFKEYGYHQHATLFVVEEDQQRTRLVHYDNSYGASLGSDCIQQFGTAVKAYHDKIYFSCTDENDGCMKCFDENGQLQRLSGYHGGIEDFEVTDEGIIFIGLRDQKLQEIYFLKDESETQLTHFNSDYHANTAVSPIEKIEFYNDGIRHEGFVIKPADFDVNKKYPGILEIHGGPKGTFGPVINHEMQVFAANGYFVFYCNPRGSDSRGNAFADIRGRFGKEDYSDLMTFTDAVLAKYPQLDGERLGVTGSSYGGYMSNWIITQTDRFKAAIPEASISNYVTKFLCTDIGFTYNMDNQAATPRSDVGLVWEQSPLKYADRVKTPTMFIHSDQDYRCWIAEPIQMFYALKLHGVETRFLLFHGEHHGLPIFGKPTHRIQRLTAMVEWFDKHCK